MAALNGQSITGDAVRLEDDERLDKPDALAIQSLIFETMIRSFGGLFGGAGAAGQPSVEFSGCLHAPSTSWDSGSKIVTFGAGLLLDAGTLTSPSGSPGARIVRHDPTLAGQTSTLDLTSYHPSTQCLIWAKRTYTSAAVPGVPGALDTRKRWNTSDDAEESFSTYTRFGERVEWTAATATIVSGLVSGTPTYPSGTGWIPCYRVTWSAGTPSFSPISGFEAGMNGTSFVDASAAAAMAMGSGNAMAVAYLLRRLRNGVAYLRDNTGTTNWDSNVSTYRGVKQLDTDLTTAENDITGLVGDITTLQDIVGYACVTAVTVKKSGGSWVVTNPTSTSVDRISSVTRSGTGVFEFVLEPSVMAAGGGDFEELTSIQVTLNTNNSTPSVVVIPSSEIEDATVGEFTVRFFNTSATVTDPADDGFTVAVFARTAFGA